MPKGQAHLMDQLLRRFVKRPRRIQPRRSLLWPSATGLVTAVGLFTQSGQSSAETSAAHFALAIGGAIMAGALAFNESLRRRRLSDNIEQLLKRADSSPCRLHAPRGSDAVICVGQKDAPN
jgi:hypothetical protein